MFNLMFFLCLIGISFISQSILTVSFATQVPNEAMTSGEKIPELKDLVDLKRDYGLDLNKVDKRQVLLRRSQVASRSNEKTKPEVSKDIVNLLQLKDRLIPAQKRILRLKSDIKAKMEEINKKSSEIDKSLVGRIKSQIGFDKDNAKEDLKRLKSELSDLNQKLTTQQKEPGFQNADYLQWEISRLEKQIVAALKEFGLTEDHIKKAPSWNTWTSSPEYKGEEVRK